MLEAIPKQPRITVNSRVNKKPGARPGGPKEEYPIANIIRAMKIANPIDAAGIGKYMPDVSKNASVIGKNSRKFK